MMTSLGHLGSCVTELVVVMFLVRGTWSVCPGNPDRSEPNVVVDEANYDRNYSSITSDGKQPLGFTKEIWQFNQPEATPCFKVTGASTRRLEIMVQYGNACLSSKCMGGVGSFKTVRSDEEVQQVVHDGYTLDEENVVTQECKHFTCAGGLALNSVFETSPAKRLCVKVTNAQVECSDPGTGRLYSCLRSTADTLYVEFTCDSQCTESDVQFWYRLVLGATSDTDPEDHWCDNRNREYPEDLLVLPSGFPINTHTEKPGGGSCRHSINLIVVSVISLFYVMTFCF